MIQQYDHIKPAGSRTEHDRLNTVIHPDSFPLERPRLYSRVIQL